MRRIQRGKDDAAMLEWAASMDKYYPGGDKASAFTVYGYLLAQTVIQVLTQCGDELTGEKLMKQAGNLKNLELGTLLPGIWINTAPDDYFPVKQMQMGRFVDDSWHLFGPIFKGAPDGG
jgi:branched-chain amino acid transport system substrate-binding protein